MTTLRRRIRRLKYRLFVRPRDQRAAKKRLIEAEVRRMDKGDPFLFGVNGLTPIEDKALAQQVHDDDPHFPKVRIFGDPDLTLDDSGKITLGVKGEFRDSPIYAGRLPAHVDEHDDLSAKQAVQRAADDVERFPDR